MDRSGWRFPRDVPPSVEGMLDDEAVQRIIQSTKAKRVAFLYCADELRIDLLWCLSRYRSEEMLRSKGWAKERQQHLLKISKFTTQFARLFEGGPVETWSRNQIVSGLPRTPARGRSFKQVMSKVALVGEIAKRAADPKSPHHAIYVLTRENSALETLIAGDLREVFERHTNTRANRNRPSAGGEAKGPFIEFAVSALKELGIKSVKPETVARALSRRGKSRRKAKAS